MHRYRFLSYFLGKISPIYGNELYSINLEKRKSIDNGDRCNTYWIGLENHVGTHIDAPAHFFQNGKKISDFPAETWLFKQPYIVNIDLKENGLVRVKDIEKIPEDVDFLIIKSGFYRFRGSKSYSLRNPGIEPDVGCWLRAHRPLVRAVGFDFISASPYQDRDLGQRTHMAFLDPNGKNNPIFIIEDMDLSGDLTSLKEIFIAPLLVEDVDSTPCTVIGTFGG